MTTIEKIEKWIDQQFEDLGKKEPLHSSSIQDGMAMMLLRFERFIKKVLAEEFREKPEIWVVTRQINQYDQDGEYFTIAYDHMPTKEELRIDLSENNETFLNNLIYSGGGRINNEDEWFFLRRQQ